MNPPSVFDYPEWDGASDCYAVFVGTAGGVVNPIIFITGYSVKMVSNTSDKAFCYIPGGTIGISPIDGSWGDVTNEIIAKGGLPYTRDTHLVLEDFDISSIEYRVMEKN